MNLKLLGIAYAGFIAVMLLSAEIYAFVYDIEPNSHVVDHYIKDMVDLEGAPISLQEWMDKNDQKWENALDWFADECDSAFDITGRSPYGYGHNDRD